MMFQVKTEPYKPSSLEATVNPLINQKYFWGCNASTTETIVGFLDWVSAGPPCGLYSYCPPGLLPSQNSIFPWPCATALGPAAPTRPQPGGNTPPAATLGSGCLSAHTVHLGNSYSHLSREVSQSFQLDSRFPWEGPTLGVCASHSPIPHANMWLPIHLITLYRKLNVLQLHYLWYRWGL